MYDAIIPQSPRLGISPLRKSLEHRAKAGFTGTRKDKLGRNRCYRDGKPTTCQPQQQAAQKQPAQQEQQPAPRQGGDSKLGSGPTRRPSKQELASVSERELQTLARVLGKMGDFVALSDLRPALPWSREQADKVIMKAVWEGLISLPGYEGRGGVKPEDELAGFRDDMENPGKQQLFAHVQVRPEAAAYAKQEAGNKYAPPPEGERIVAPPCCLHDPDPTRSTRKDGVTDAARVGVPGMSAPPPPDEIPRLPNLTVKERRAEGDFANAYLGDPDGMVQAYNDARNKVVGQDDKGDPRYAIGDAPNIFNLDDCKLLSSDYNPRGVGEDEVKNARGTYNAVVHQTANAVAKRAFLQHLDTLPEDRKLVLVTSGGVAAGKGYALANIPETKDLMGKAGAVWDAAGEQLGTENPWIMEECRKRGIKMVFAFIHADPVNTWENPQRGVVERAGKIGRMVDARLFADSYSIGAKNFHNFMSANNGAEDAEFFVLDNSKGGKPERAEAVPQHALDLDSERLYGKAVGVLKERAGQLKPAVLRGGTIGERLWGKPKAGEGQ